MASGSRPLAARSRARLEASGQQRPGQLRILFPQAPPHRQHLEPAERLDSHVGGRPLVRPLEEGQPVHGLPPGHDLVQEADLQVVEVLPAGGEEGGEGDGLRQRPPFGHPAAADDHAGHVVRVAEGHLQRHAGAAGESGGVDPPFVHGEPGAGVVPHGRDGRLDPVPGAVLRVVGAGHDPAVLLGGRPEQLHRHPPPRPGIEAEEQRPLPLGGVPGRQVEGVALGGVAAGHDPLGDLAGLESAGRRGGRGPAGHQSQRQDQDERSNPHGETPAMKLCCIRGRENSCSTTL